jgi:hypothetical protein
MLLDDWIRLPLDIGLCFLGRSSLFGCIAANRAAMAVTGADDERLMFSF